MVVGGGRGWERGLRGVRVLGVGEAGLDVGDSGEVEGQIKGRDVDVDGGKRLDAAGTTKSFGAEVGAIGQVEDGFGGGGGEGCEVGGVGLGDGWRSFRRDRGGLGGPELLEGGGCAHAAARGCVLPAGCHCVAV